MSSELESLIAVGHDMWVVSHVYLVLITDMGGSCQHRNQGNPFPTVPALAKLTQSTSQYYAMATCTILFYDYLLMLADEARQLYSVRVLCPSLRPRFF